MIRLARVVRVADRKRTAVYSCGTGFACWSCCAGFSAFAGFSCEASLACWSCGAGSAFGALRALRALFARLAFFTGRTFFARLAFFALLAFRTGLSFVAIAQRREPFARGLLEFEESQFVFGLAALELCDFFCEQQIALAFGSADLRCEFFENDISQPCD